MACRTIPVPAGGCQGAGDLQMDSGIFCERKYIASVFMKTGGCFSKDIS